MNVDRNTPDLEAGLPNGSSGDALVLARLPLTGRNLQFDAGDARRVPREDLLRLSHLFVSHCHVDHFMGFDALVRPRVCRAESFATAGPPGYLARVEARLRGYDWNLVDGNHFTLIAREMLRERIRVARFDSSRAFARADLPDEPTAAFPLPDVGLEAEAQELDHHLPCMGWAVQAPPRVHVRPGALETLGLAPGRWIADLKRRALDAPSEDRFELPDGAVRPVGELVEALLEVARGTRLAFVTDTICDATTRPRIVRLAAQADVFACGAPFLHAEHAERARMTRHLTAAQAGEMAAEAGARELLLFHVSDRHGGDVSRHVEEAHDAAQGRVAIRVGEPWPVVE